MQLIIFVGICVGWVSTYVYRVATKQMTYVKQLEQYEDAVMRKRLDEMTEEEVAEMIRLSVVRKAAFLSHCVLNVVHASQPQGGGAGQESWTTQLNPKVTDYITENSFKNTSFYKKSLIATIIKSLAIGSLESPPHPCRQRHLQIPADLFEGRSACPPCAQRASDPLAAPCR